MEKSPIRNKSKVVLNVLKLFLEHSHFNSCFVDCSLLWSSVH